MFNYKSILAGLAALACSVSAVAGSVIMIRDGAAISLSIETKGRNLYDIKGQLLEDKEGNAVVLRGPKKGESLFLNVKAVGHNGKVVIFDAENEDMIGARLSVMKDDQTEDVYNYITDENIIRQAQDFLTSYRNEQVDVSTKSWAQLAVNGSWLKVGTSKPGRSEYDGVVSSTAKGSKVVIVENKKCQQFVKWMAQKYYSPKDGEIINTLDEQSRLAKLRMSRKDHAMSSGKASQDFYSKTVYGNRVYTFGGLLNRTNKVVAIGNSSNLGKCLGIDIKASSYAKNTCVELDFPNSEVNFTRENCPAMKNVEVYDRDGIYQPFHELYRDLKDNNQLNQLDMMMTGYAYGA